MASRLKAEIGRVASHLHSSSAAELLEGASPSTTREVERLIQQTSNTSSKREKPIGHGAADGLFARQAIRKESFLFPNPVYSGLLALQMPRCGTGEVSRSRRSLLGAVI